MTSTLSRRSLLTGFVTVVVGGIAGYAVARNRDVAKGSPNTNLYGQSTVTPDNQTYLLPLIKVPRGGGAIVDAHNVVVTRDNNGALHGFSAICTHQSCTLNQVANGTIDCPCHGSKFNADTGAVVAGPATRPLPKVALSVKRGNVYIA